MEIGKIEFGDPAYRAATIQALGRCVAKLQIPADTKHLLPIVEVLRAGDDHRKAEVEELKRRLDLAQTALYNLYIGLGVLNRSKIDFSGLPPQQRPRALEDYANALMKEIEVPK